MGDRIRSQHGQLELSSDGETVTVVSADPETAELLLAEYGPLGGGVQTSEGWHHREGEPYYVWRARVWAELRLIVPRAHSPGE